MRYYIDRIEGGIAVMDSEGGERITVSVGRLPDGVRDGSVLILMPDGVFLMSLAPDNITTKRPDLLKGLIYAFSQ